MLSPNLKQFIRCPQETVLSRAQFPWHDYGICRRRALRLTVNPLCCNGRAGTDSRKYVVWDPRLRHWDTNVIRRLSQSRRETVIVTYPALVNADHRSTGRTLASYDAINAAVAQEKWRSWRDILRKLGMLQPRALDVLSGDQSHSYHYSTQTDVGPTHPPVHWVAGALTSGLQWLVCGAVSSLPLMPSSCTRRQQYFITARDSHV